MKVVITIDGESLEIGPNLVGSQVATYLDNHTRSVDYPFNKFCQLVADSIRWHQQEVNDQIMRESNFRLKRHMQENQEC